MQLVEMVEDILRTGLLPLAVERQMKSLLDRTALNESEQAMIDRLLEALTSGTVHPVA